jgi:hypothetical protein
MGNLLIYSAAEIFCIWLRARPRCQLCPASLGRKSIRRGRCASLSALPLAGRPIARLIAQWLSGLWLPLGVFLDLNPDVDAVGDRRRMDVEDAGIGLMPNQRDLSQCQWRSVVAGPRF